MIDNPRMDLVIAKYGTTVLIALALVGVLAVGATGWAVADPPTTNTTQQVGSETVSTEVGTSAVVVEDGLWNETEVLEDRPVYLLNATPVVTITPRTTVPSDNATVTHEVTVRTEAVRNGAVFWNETADRQRTVAPIDDGVAASELSVDVRTLADREGELADELRDVGSVRHTVEVTVEYETAANSGTRTMSTSIHVTDRAYWFDESLSDSKTHTQRAQIEVTQSRSPVLVGGLLLLGVLSLAGAAVVWDRRPVDLETARRRVHERRYAEWISHGTIPMWIGEHHVSLDTLEDVVDVAIDTNERVVHDRQRDLFAVVSDGVVYYYSANGFWEETAWPEMDFEGGQAAGNVDTGQPPEQGPVPSDQLPDADDDDAWHQL